MPDRRVFSGLFITQLQAIQMSHGTGYSFQAATTCPHPAIFSEPMCCPVVRAVCSPKKGKNKPKNQQKKTVSRGRTALIALSSLNSKAAVILS